MSTKVWQTASGLPLKTTPVTAAPVDRVALLPEFVEVPKPGQICPFSSLRRGLMHQLIRDGKIRSVNLRKPGHTRGKRLVELASLLTFLGKQVEGGELE